MLHVCGPAVGVLWSDNCQRGLHRRLRIMLRIVWDKLGPDRIAEKFFSLSASCTLAFALLVVAGTIITTAGQPESRAAAPAEMPIDFDIPAQPLATALEAFSAVSGYQILMGDAGSGAGYSKAVKGAFSPREALIQVISGTGLEVRFTSVKAAILVGHVSSRNASTPAVPGGDQEQLEAQLQNDVMRALCRARRTPEFNGRSGSRQTNCCRA
jgi:hypothetical protein